ncbi:MAG: phosphoribosylformylglycinamidine synthase subunit PurL, partial [Micrococcales bacterium]|nr:phosphoribosylformylglycinamidine synthase subunit PurL [Micrococcales bacterium]
KSSKVHLRGLPVSGPQVIQGPGENAGVVDIGAGLACVFKMESHNHPSYIEPFQGAATGVGGIVRDIISMGARPVAVMDQLRFGKIDEPDTARVVHGVVAGISHYGNCLGLPNIGGETYFDPVYQGNPLVNALAVGVLRHEDLHLANAEGVGNKVVLFGARTGGDGIGGASILASDTFSSTGPTKRPAVQVGDPFAEKVLIECCLELFREHLVDGIQDLGAAGISCATSELASNGDGGMFVELDSVLLRDPSLTAEEILMSESQERMAAVVRPDRLDAFCAITAKWDVETAVIGEVTGDGRLTIDHFGQRIVDVDPRTVALDGPVYDRPYARPDWLDALQADTVSGSSGAAKYPRPTTPDELRATVLALVASPNLASKSWVTDQYDRFVQGNTALAQPDDAGVVRVDETTGLGVALATDANGRYAQLDPYAGAQLALAEAYRNVACCGARPLAVTDCLNIGSPERTDAMWQLVQVIEGMADACRVLGVPVTGGNVSLYNTTGAVAIHPTPVAGVLGVLDDVATVVPSGWTAPDEAIYLLGATHDELDGSAWADALWGQLGGRPPAVDLAAEARLARVLIGAAHGGIADAAHDLSEGGLAIGLVEACLRFGVGARVTLDELCARDGVTPFAALFAESSARALVAVPPVREQRLVDLCAAVGVPALRLGVTCSPAAHAPAAGDAPAAHAPAAHMPVANRPAASAPAVAIACAGGRFTLPLAELRAASEATLRRHFG